MVKRNEGQPADNGGLGRLATDPLERRKFLLGSVGIAGLAALAGCSSSSSSGSPGSGSSSSPGPSNSSSASPKSLINVSLMLDFLPNIDDVHVAVAQKFGYFADEGLNVKLTNPSDAQINAIPELVGLGKFDFGMQSVPVGLFARSAGSPVLAVAGWGQRSEGIISLKANPVSGPSSLIGKTVATYNAADFKAFMVSFMRSAQLQTSQVKLVNTDFTAPVIASGKAYAGLGIRWGELLDTEAEVKKPCDFLSFFDGNHYGIPQMNYLQIFTSENFASKNPDTVKAMVRAMARGYKKAYTMSVADLTPIMNKWCSTGPTATGDLKTNLQKFQASRPFAFYGTNTDPNTAAYFEMPLGSIPAVSQWLEDTGVAKQIKDLSSYATNEFITPGALHPSV